MKPRTFINWLCGLVIIPFEFYIISEMGGWLVVLTVLIAEASLLYIICALKENRWDFWNA